MLPLWIDDLDVLMRHEGCVCDRLLRRHFGVAPGDQGDEQQDDGQRGEDEVVG